ncbi:MAG: class I SAM-dependent methyltransferase [Spirochaetes bacterium]|nr:class I SAM-dependent methyltransferase [Spirochaetota bacterium]
MIKPYTEIPDVYDYILRHVDYERWYRYIRSLIFRYMKDPHYILEIGCGTGRFGAKFSRDDFHVFGMDRSPEMLKVAKARARKNFRIFCGDARRFAVARKFDFIFSVHDTLNYLTEHADLLAAFRSAGAALHDEGVFMFDLTTEHNIRRFFDGRVSRHVRGGVEVTWDNRYDPAARMVYSTLTVKRRGAAARTEEHAQRIYFIDEAKALLGEAGLELVDLFSDYTFDPPSERTIMVNFVARRKR